MDYVMGQPWFVLRSSDIETEQTVEVDRQVMLVDLCDDDLHRVDTVFKCIAEAMEASASAEAPLLIAVLPAGQAAPSVVGGVQKEACKKLLAAQKRLHELGVFEVIFRGISAAETHLSVQMALQRLEHKSAIWAAWEADVREEERAARKIIEERAEESCQKFGEDMWAHFDETSVASVLPPVDVSLPTKIVMGAQIGDLLLDRVLGRGGFGTVCQASNVASSSAEAVKIFSKKRHPTISRMLSVGAEVEVMRKLQHPNVVSMLGVYHSARHVFVRMELVGSTTLMKLLSEHDRVGLPANQTRELFRQLLEGVAYCHGRGIAHCDIKPENLGLSDDKTCLKILDFGCASAADAIVGEIRGTMPFLAPEILLGGGYAPMPVDVWAAGVVLVEMMAGVGSLNRLMGWAANAKVTVRLGEELQAALAARPHAIRNMACEACGRARAELAPLLDAALAAAPQDRASAAELAQSRWLAHPPKQQQDEARIRHIGGVEALPPPRPRGRGQQLASRLRRYAPVATTSDVPAAPLAADAST